MGLNVFSLPLSALSKNNSLRLWAPLVLPKISYPYERINKFVATCEAGSRPKGGIDKNLVEGAISLGGEQIAKDGTVDLSRIPFVEVDFYKASRRGKILDGDILICKDGALTGKSCWIDLSVLPSSKVMANEHIYILRGNDRINQKFLYYYTTTGLFQSQVKDLAYRKKAQPGLNSDHFKKIRIPDIPIDIQEEIIKRLQPLESKLVSLKAALKYPQEVIDEVISDSFKFDIEEVRKVEHRKFFKISDQLAYRNFRVRGSARWAKVAPIQKELYRDNSYIRKLGKYITSTRNGWSPICRETDTKYGVFGVNSISKDTTISYDDLKLSNQERRGIENYFARKGDLFVSRGNTVNLVALASVVKDIPEGIKVIYPDLFIKIEVDETELSKEYLAFIFNSIIGRCYFKYSSKGKNQTMVKVSSDELNNFYMPIPAIDVQRQIVAKINTKLDQQKEIRERIVNVTDDISRKLVELMK